MYTDHVSSLGFIDRRGQWPFPAVTEARKSGKPIWVEINEKHADEVLGVLPPLYFKGGFMVSEPATHVIRDGKEMPVYAAVVSVNRSLAAPRYFMRELPFCDAVEAAAELRAAIK